MTYQWLQTSFRGVWDRQMQPLSISFLFWGGEGGTYFQTLKCWCPIYFCLQVQPEEARQYFCDVHWILQCNYIFVGTVSCMNIWNTWASMFLFLMQHPCSGCGHIYFLNTSSVTPIVDCSYWHLVTWSWKSVVCSIAISPYISYWTRGQSQDTIQPRPGFNHPNYMCIVVVLRT